MEKVNRFTSKLVEDMRTQLKSLMVRTEKVTNDAKKQELLNVGRRAFGLSATLAAVRAPARSHGVCHGYRICMACAMSDAWRAQT